MERIHQSGCWISVSCTFGPKAHKSLAYCCASNRDSRAGVPLRTQQFEETVRAVLQCPVTSLYGFYVHAGNSVSRLKPYRRMTLC